ncbi:MAG TPA: ferritin-like domain-containing protein [Polyangiales bacterium]|nr:ferritin-like domain-containing protein [Polyangiales bacterium]
MSFPFGTEVHALRQRLLCAIGGSGLLGLGLAAAGCDSLDDANKDAGMTSPSAGASGSTVAGRAGSSVGTGGSAGMTMPDASAPLSCELGFMPTKQCFTRTEMEGKARFGCGQVPKTPAPTDQEVADSFLASGCLSRTMACDGCCNPASSDGTPMGDGSCCYVFCPGACCGRPFEVGGELRLPGVSERNDWLGAVARHFTAQSEHVVSAALAQRIAREWLDDARMEHASIASFARFTLDLLAAGAPADLLAQAQRAALDEVAHAQACFALASRYAGTAFGPSALATGDCAPAASLTEAVVSAFREGCIGETLAAAHARAALAVARDPQVRSTLTRIAEDEARHAELAWRFAAWGLPRCTGDLRARLQHELDRALAEQPAPPLEREPAELLADLHAAGRLSAAQRLDLARRSLREVVVPCAEALLAWSPAHAPSLEHATLS